MRRFIIKVILFVLPAVLVLSGMELLMRHIPNSYRQKYEWMSEHGGDVQTLILGNSHGVFGIKPDMLGTSAYNLCNVSQTFEYDDFLLRHFYPLCKQLKTVILVVDHSNFFDPPLEDGEPYRCIYYRLYMHYPKHALFSRYGFELADVTAARKKVQNWYKNKHIPYDHLGWNTSYRKECRRASDLTDDNARKTVLRHHQHGLKYVEDNKASLFSIAAFCQQNHLRLILLQTPVLSAYNRAIEFVYDDALQKSLLACKEQYGAVIADYSADQRFSYDDLFDADHLNHEGAEKLSAILRTLIP